jgi:uncharacterized tellurite resistance protein B-like protein
MLELSKEDRLLLLRFVCAFAWTDLEVRESERRFIRRLVSRLELDADDARQVEEWLTIAPSPQSVDPGRIPAAHRRVFLDAARAIVYADGEVEAEEREQLDRLKAALGG